MRRPLELTDVGNNLCRLQKQKKTLKRWKFLYYYDLKYYIIDIIKYELLCHNPQAHGTGPAMKLYKLGRSSLPTTNQFH